MILHPRGERETRVTGDKAQVTMGRLQKGGEARFSSSRPPLRANFHRERGRRLDTRKLVGAECCVFPGAFEDNNLCKIWGGKPNLLERFSYDLEMKTHEQNRDNKRMDIERIQTPVAFGWLCERSG